MTSGQGEAAMTTQAKRLRVLIVDDNSLFRVGMASILGAYEDIEVVAQASGGRMGVRLARELRPDVVLMELRMPDLDGPSATKAILGDNSSARIVALTVTADEADIAAAVDAGACGYMLKDSRMDDVAEAIRAAAGGTAWLSPRAAQALVDLMRREHTEAVQVRNPEIALSAREIEVLRLVARGLDNNEVAAELSISPSTAKNHVSSILGKLGVSNRLQAAIYAVQQGIAVGP
jgi:DNA-binding NarL/FixJ family response regulator